MSRRPSSAPAKKKEPGILLGRNSSARALIKKKSSSSLLDDTADQREVLLKGGTPHEDALVVMQMVYEGCGKDPSTVAGVSTLDKLQSFRTEPALDILKNTTWRNFFASRNSNQTGNDAVINHMRPKSASAASKVNRSMPQVSKHQRTLEEQQRKLFDNISATFDRMISRVEMLWNALNLPESDRLFYKQSLCKGPPSSMDHCREVAQYISMLQIHRKATINVLKSIESREVFVKRCYDVIAALSRKSSRRDTQSFNDDSISLWRQELLISLKDVQLSSLSVIQNIQIWRKNLWRPQPFMWKGGDGSKPPIYDSTLRPKWSDVEVANTYQLLCKLFILKSKTVLGDNDTPAFLFDGYMFHHIISELRLSDECYKDNTVELESASIQIPLPIDQHKDEIINKVAQDRVIIIHGETGCGKSSRLPVFLLQNAEKTGQCCKIMICQPRRIAVHALMEQLKKTLGGRVGMRMGGGVREGRNDAQLIFVTTGYLVRFVAYNHEVLDRYTHLIIDEIHERSVDSDLLCYLSRKLLSTNRNLKLILMSATMHTSLYKDYFSGVNDDFGDMECLSVGKRRFENSIHYVDDLVHNTSIKASVAKILHYYDPKMENYQALDVVVKAQYTLAKELIRLHAKRGTAVLVFVAGMSDIDEFLERFEEDKTHKIIPIHSDIPFEEQEQALIPAESDEIKVIVATNSAESSLTLTDVDTVICLGLQKSIQYDESTHTVKLVKRWISKSSATQRAGRTGRVRPGAVFRLYSKNQYEGFEEHEQPEVCHKPLQDVILNLRSVLENSADFNGVVPIMQDLLQPPDISNVKKSFDHLFDSSMISAPTDEGNLTSIGHMAGHLPIDLSLGYLIAIGISLNMAAHAIVMASALFQPKSLFCISSKMHHVDPDVYNNLMKNSLLGASFFDAGVYSEPIMMLRIFLSWQKLSTTSDVERRKWLNDHNLHYERLKQFVLMSTHLADRVNRINRVSRNSIPIDLTTMPSDLSPSDINKLRLMLTWSTGGGIIQMKPYECIHPKQLCTVSVECSAHTLTTDHFQPLFTKSLKWSMTSTENIKFSTNLSPLRQSNTDMRLLAVLAKSVAYSVPVVSVGSTLGFTVLLYMNCVNLSDEATVYFEILQRVFPNSLTKSGEILGNPVFEVKKGSKDKYLSPTDVRFGKYDFTTHSLHMIIADDGSADLIASNCKPSLESLNDIFFGLSDIGNIKETVLPKIYRLEFPEVSSKDSSSSLVTDVSIGMRILKSLVIGYDGEIKLSKRWQRSLGTVSEMAKHNPKSLVQAAIKKNKPDEVDDDAMLAIINMVPMSVWKCQPFYWSHNSALSLSKQIPARLPRQSLQSVTMHSGKHPLFALSHKVLVIEASSNNIISICDGITILPPGSKWLQLALLCLRKYDDVYQTLFGSSSAGGDAMDICLEINRTIAGIQDNPVQKNYTLIQLVDSLFNCWCDEIVDGSDFEVNARQDTNKKRSARNERKAMRKAIRKEAKLETLLPLEDDQAYLNAIVQEIQNRKGNRYSFKEFRMFCKRYANNGLSTRIKAMILNDNRVVYHNSQRYNNGEVAWNNKGFFTAASCIVDNNSSFTNTSIIHDNNNEEGDY